MVFKSEKKAAYDETTSDSNTPTIISPVNEKDYNNTESGFYDPSKESRLTRLGLTAESFKRAPGTTGGQKISGGDNMADMQERLKDSPMLQQKMKPRHLQMIAVGGSIGTGLFVGSGGALNRGGPGGVLIAWIALALLLVNVTQVLGELCIMYPVSGGFYTLSARFLSDSWAFGMGSNYVLQWAVVLPLELGVAAIATAYWDTPLTTAVWITIFFVLVIILNVFPAGYQEEEFWASLLKLTVVVIFIFASLVFVFGGGPSGSLYDSYVGGRYYSDPGPFANGFKGVCSVFVTAAFSFAGTELVGLAASETPDPRATMPSAVKGTIWRVSLIYIFSLLMIGLLIPFNEPRLLGGGGAAASPFVIVFRNAQVKGLDHLLNVVIVVSVLSIGLSCVYAGSRTLTAMAETGFAPRFFAYVDKSGRPLWSVIFILMFGPIAYVNVAAAGVDVFNWLLALSGLSTLFTWGSILLCHIRFRKAWKVQGHSVDELPFKALGGVYFSYAGLLMIFLILVAQFYVAVWPIGYQELTASEIAISFFQVYLALPVVMLCWGIGWLWKRDSPKRASEIDIDTGRKSWLTVEQMAAYRAERRAAPLYVRIYRLLFTN